MIEESFLSAIGEYLAAPGRLIPAAKLVGAVEPATVQELPALVLSLGSLERLGSGLGERSEFMTGALRWKVQIDLAHPELPGDPTFSMVSADRKTLFLPHGGLVRADGSTGQPSADDIQVELDGQPKDLTAADPAPNEFVADLLSGALSFGAALPLQGTVEVQYFISQWERRVMRTRGDLAVLVLASNAADVSGLSASLSSAMAVAPQQIAGLAAAFVTELGPVALSGKDAVAARQRSVRFHFEYELEIDVPDSSGGIIRRIPVTANLA